MKKILIVLSFMLIIPGACSVNNNPIKICLIVSLSGPGSHLYELKDAMLLAVADINKQNGINGKRIELIIVDSQSDPRIAKELFLDSEEKYQPLLYISTLSSVSKELAPLAEQNQVVLIGLVVVDPTFTEQKEYVYRYYQTAYEEVPPIIQILEKNNIRDLGILYLDDAYGNSLYLNLKNSFLQLGGTIKAASFIPASFDFTEQINILKATEAIYIGGFVKHIEKAILQLRQQGYSGIILTASGGAAADTIALSEAEGVYLAAPILYNPNFIFAREFAQRYEDLFNRILTHQPAAGYDIIKILANLLDRKPISRKIIKELLDKGFIHPGLLGNVELKQGTHDICVPLYRAQIMQGKIVYK